MCPGIGLTKGVIIIFFLILKQHLWNESCLFQNQGVEKQMEMVSVCSTTCFIKKKTLKITLIKCLYFLNYEEVY